MEVDSSERSDIDADTEVKITAFINLCLSLSNCCLGWGRDEKRPQEILLGPTDQPVGGLRDGRQPRWGEASSSEVSGKSKKGLWSHNSLAGPRTMSPQPPLCPGGGGGAPARAWVPSAPAVRSAVRWGQGGHGRHLVSTHFILHFMARIEVRMVRIKCLDVAGRRLGPAQQTPIWGDWWCGHQGDTDREQRPEGAVHWEQPQSGLGGPLLGKVISHNLST